MMHMQFMLLDFEKQWTREYDGLTIDQACFCTTLQNYLTQSKCNLTFISIASYRHNKFGR